MEKKIRIGFEVLVVIVLVGYYLIKTAIPGLRETMGSSGHLFDYKQYHSMVEVIIDDQCDIGFVMNSKGVVYHLLFFDKNAVSLYNQDIENQNVEDALDQSIVLLLSNQLLQNDSSISIVSYGKPSSRFMEAFQFSLSKNFLSPTITQEEGNVIERAKSINANVTEEKDALEAMDYYSKNLSVSSSEGKKTTSLEPSSAARGVYRKLEDYANSQNIQNMELNQVTVPIQSIPIDNSSNYYPNENSWYYILEGRIYTYIEFIYQEKTYGYCFQGSIDDIREGKCES